MKKFVFVSLVLLALTACHDKIWDKLNDHEARIARLEALCNQFNTNISSLQSLVDVLNARDYIKDVVPVMENGKTIGYAITFSRSNPITIYNGSDGADGHTPIIGIKSDSGVWYWTLDGDWLLDTDGQRVRADATTPQLKIEDDYWWVSYDSGKSWVQLGAAISGGGSGSASPGSGSGSGDSMFREVRQDDHYVYFILANGEEIKIAKGGTLTWVYV